MKVSLSEGMWELWYLVLIFSVLYVCFLFCTFATIRLMFLRMQGGTSCGNSRVSRGMPFMFPLSCQVGISVYYSKIPCNFIAPQLHFHKEQQLCASALDIWSIWRTELSCFAYEWWQCNILGEILCSFKAAVALSDRCVGNSTQVHMCQSSALVDKLSCSPQWEVGNLLWWPCEFFERLHGWHRKYWCFFLREGFCPGLVSGTTLRLAEWTGACISPGASAAKRCG